MSHFFIGRPVFASVIAILIMLAGGICLYSMPMSQFPKLTPPTISMVIEYQGSSAQIMQDSIAQVVEQQMIGVDKLLYMSSVNSSEGRTNISLTFDPSMDPDIAQMQVQNRLQMVMPKLPETVKNQGVRVRKVSSSYMQFYAFYSKDGSVPVQDVADFVSSVLLDPLCRLDGVGEASLFGSPYAMRIWLDPNRLRSYNITPNDVVKAVEAQNVQVPVGQIGGLPATGEQRLNVTMLSRTQLNTVDQFADIVVHVNPDGSAVHVRDVARVEMGRQSYWIDSRYLGSPAANVGIQLAEGANAVETSKTVAAFMKRMEQYFPDSIVYNIPYDTVPFIKASLNSVFHTLIEAIVLVAAIMFLFLQSWRAMLVPLMAIPIVLLGTMAIMAGFGSSINTLSMFGLVLAIGLLVDDAIVVVENTERIMHQEGLDATEAIHKSMDQITGALVGVAAVLSAVFIPMAFFGGMPGAIYREFTMTIVSAMLLSVFVAITITPPMCALLLRRTAVATGHGFFSWFNRGVERTTEAYVRSVRRWIAHRGLVMLAFVALTGAAGYALKIMPTSFLPIEDQGIINLSVFMPPGSTRAATLEVVKEIERYLLEEEKDTVVDFGIATGSGPNGARGQNVAQGYMHLRHWDERRADSQSAAAIIARATARFGSHKSARIIFFQPPQVSGLGNSAGITLQLEDQGGLGYDALVEARAELLAKAADSPLLMRPRTSSLEDVPQMNLIIDDLKAGVYGVDAGDVNDDLSAAWGGIYVNDFVDRGRVKRVYVQGDSPFRMNVDNMNLWHTRNDRGEMVPLSSVVTPQWTYGPAQLERFNGVQSTIIEAVPAPGVSSGDAMNEFVRLVDELPHGIGLEWTGLTFQESRSGSQTVYLYALSILVVFLCLAALYESWSIPFAVILVVPIGVLGALGLSTLRGLSNDIYFQVGLLAVIGLSAKNAILIVEFAKSLHKQGRRLHEAAIEAARMRLRPIVMTSLAFLLGVLPMALSHGAGASSQHAIGTGIIGGTFLATALGVFFIPVFFVVVNRFFDRLSRGRRHERERDGQTSPEEAAR